MEKQGLSLFLDDIDSLENLIEFGDIENALKTIERIIAGGQDERQRTN